MIIGHTAYSMKYSKIFLTRGSRSEIENYESESGNQEFRIRIMFRILPQTEHDQRIRDFVSYLSAKMG